jgi:uncharacterized protein
MPNGRRSLTLSLFRETYAVLKLAPEESIPAWATRGELSSVTRTPDELSIVTQVDNLPPGEQLTQKWSAFKVHGPFAFTETGVLASLAKPLADAKIGIFVISTFDTDYLLVNADEVQKAANVLRAAGHVIADGDFTFQKTKGNSE